jgi:two-component system cell cycle sensor histidine kinase PleC
MTPFLRYFTVISFAAIIVAILGAGMFYRSVIEDKIIARVTEDQNLATANGFKRAVWPRYAKGLSKLPCRTPPCPDPTSFLEDLKGRANKYFNELPIVKYGLYFPSGEEIFTGKQFTSNPNLQKESRVAFLAAQYGNIKTTLVSNYVYDGKIYNVVQTFVPIFVEKEGNSTGKVAGIVEVVYDISPVWNDPYNMQLIATLFIILTLIIFYGVTIYSSKQAEIIISKQHEAAIDLTSAKASAEEENEAKSKFLANISHELRTPLNAIIGFSEILKEEALGALGNAQYKDYVRDIHSSGVHLLSLINDILDFSKAEAGKLEVDMKDVDITKIMKNSMRLVLPRAQEAKIELIEKIPKEHIVIKTDAKRLKQVLLNLLSNSVKFTPEGGTVTLFSWSNVAEGKLIIEVEDSGVGIKDKDISKAMASFGQAENQLSRKYEGTGLGLPLSKKLIELMGGTFDIRSKQGVGTTVTITLPQFDDQEERDIT